jgi:hypothetical protein
LSNHKLTNRFCETVTKPSNHADGDGLYLKVDESRKGWVCRYSFDGRVRSMGLGAFPEVGLAEARERAAAAHRQVRDGIDPIAAREAARAARLARRTFGLDMEHTS